MRRIFWIGTGVALTMFVMVKGRQVISRYTPTALTERVGEQAADLSHRAGDVATGFLADFRSAAGERENELRDSLLADSQGSLEDLQDRRDAYQGDHAGALRRDRRATNKFGVGTQSLVDDDSEDDELGYSF